MHLMDKIGCGCKYSDKFERRIRRGFKNPAYTEDLDWLFRSMKDRIVVGEARYGLNTSFHYPDQTAALGRGWRQGYDFFATAPRVWRVALENKLRALYRTANGDLVPDVLNYIMFLELTGDLTGAQTLALRAKADVAVSYFLRGRRRQIRGYHERSLDQSIVGVEAAGSVRPVNKYRV